MSEQIRKILQKAFILGTGRGATAVELEWAQGLVSADVSYIKVVHTVNEYMDSMARDQGVANVLKKVVKNAHGIVLSDLQTTTLITELLARGVNTWAKLFEDAAFRDDSWGKTLDNRAEASVQFLSALEGAGKSGFFTGPAVNQAMTTLLQNISSSTTSLNNGISGMEALAGNLTATGITGTVFGVGYITGATVFADGNHDGLHNPGEWSTVTDGNGKFELPNSNTDGKLIAFNGTGLMTGNQFRSVFSSIAGTTALNTFTTLIEGMMANNPARTVAEATTALRTALNLPADINLLSYDPLAILASSTTSTEEKQLALSVQARAQQITNVLTQTAATIVVTTNSQTQILNASRAVVIALDKAISAAASQAVRLDLTSIATLDDIIGTVARATGSTLTPTQTQQIAQVTAGSNVSAAAAINITELSQTVTVSLGDATNALIAGASAGSFNNAVAGFTGTALDAANLAAGVGFIDAVVPVPPPLGPPDITAPSATVSVTQAGSGTDGAFLVTITFNKPVSGFTNANLTAANGTLSDITSTDGGITWTSTLRPSFNVSQTNNVVTLISTGIRDAAGNLASGTVTSNSFLINTDGPSSALVVTETSLKAGETTDVTNTFNKVVVGLSIADMVVENGTLTNIVSLDGGLTWTATFTPTADITDTTNVITLDNTRIADLSGNKGIGTTVSNNYAIDTLRPTASIMVTDNALTSDETTQVTITFNEVVTGFSNADLSIENGNLSSVASVDGITWTATFTPTANISDSTNVITLTNSGVTDGKGNSGAGTSKSNNYTIDTLRPTATIVVAESTLGTGETSAVTITFSETVSGFSNADLSIANGTLSSVASADNITWTAVLTPDANLANTSNVITLANSGIADSQGNTGTGTTVSNSYAIDTLQPAASILVADTTLKLGETSAVTITFDEVVTGFTNADLSIANGTLTNVSSADGGMTWNATLTPTLGISNTGNVITLANTGINDGAGNAGTGTTVSNKYAIDTLRPGASIVVTDTALKAGETSSVTFTFTEAVSNFTKADLSIANGTLSAVSSLDGGITWTATLTPLADTTDTSNLITLAKPGIADLAGNAGIGTTNSNNYAIDTLRPTATIVLADTALQAGKSSAVTVTFNEAVSGFTNADLTVENGTLSAVASVDSIVWTATFTPTVDKTDVTNVITLANTGVTDVSGNTGIGTTGSNSFTVDTLRPTANIVIADTALKAGDTSLVTITFSEAVTGFTNADLSVENGILSNVSSADNVIWTATFTPTADLSDTVNVITLTNSGVNDVAGNAGIGTTVSDNYEIDTLRPSATIVVADAALKVGETSGVTITFDDAVTGFTNADLSIANGTLTDVSTIDDGHIWTATFTPTTNMTDTTNVISLANTGVADLAGNAGAGTTHSNNYAIDTLQPTATIVVADTALKLGESSDVTITFNEVVNGFTNADLPLSNGTLSSVATTDNIIWTAVFSPTADITDTTNIISLANTGVTDAAGNAGTGSTNSNNFAIDTRRPTATLVVTDADIKAGETSLVTITFSEATSGFTNADLSIAAGTLTDVSSTDGGITWTATFTPSVDTHDITNLIVLTNIGVTDAAGNAGTGTTSSNNYEIDTLRPTASIVIADTALKAGETSAVTITFNEAVSGFTNADLSIANGTLTKVSTLDGGITWTATLTPTAATVDSTNVISLVNAGVTDAAGNAGSGTTNSNNYAIDTLRPTASIVVADASLKAGETSLVTVTFNEAVSGFTNTDLSIANGTLTDVATADGGITWTATLTPTADLNDTTNVITLANTGVSDVAGNAGTGTTSSNNYAIDTLRPTASIVVADTALKAGETSLVTVTFNEAVSGFTNGDLSIANGTLTDVATADGGITWTATLTPTADLNDTTNVITLANTGVSDVAGNAGIGTTNSNNYAIDTVRPTASIVVADASLKAGETSLVTVTFNEAVTGFSTADLTVDNGSVDNVSSTDGGITWTNTLTPGANITDTSNIVTLATTGVLDAAGNAGAGNTTSNNYQIDTEEPTLTKSSPVDDATKVLVNSNLVLTFSETVVAGTGNIVVSDGTNTLSIPVADAQVSITGSTVTINPGVHLKPNALYSVQMAAGVLVDLSGNPYAGIADSTTLSFTTATDTLTINPVPGALTIADSFWADVNAINKVVITTTATGTQSIVTGDNFNKAFAEGIELSTTSSTGTILVDLSSFTTGTAKLNTVSTTGNQTILGSVNADNLTMSTYAATGNIINTGAGNDVITIINTGDANGSAYVITGGLGADTINLDTAQVSPDTLVFGDNDSGITLLSADKITGFNGTQDSLKMFTAATAGNYIEVTAPVADFAAAFTAANTALATLANGAEKFAFVWDTSNGYVFNDTNGDSVADQVIVLVGINDAQFAMVNIIA